MPYTDQRKFHADYYKTDLKHPPIKHVSIDFAWNLYTWIFNSKTRGLDFQVIGRHVYKYENRPSATSAEQLSHEMTGIGAEEFVNLNAQLVENWSVALNDAWLLGGINSLAEFHPASPLTFKNVLDETYVVTVTGRELIGLALAGYTEEPLALGKGFFPPANKEKAEGLTLTAYDDKVCELTKDKELGINQATVLHYLTENKYTIGKS